MHRSALLCVGIASASVALAQAQEPALVDLRPPTRAGSGVRNLTAALGSVFTGRAYWYAEPIVSIETVPAAAELSFTYLRAGRQERFERPERGVGPVRVRLPSRVRAGADDFLAVRATAPGHSDLERELPVIGAPGELVLVLEALPNRLVGLDWTHLGGRTTLRLRTTEKPQLRVRPREGEPGLWIALGRTADALETPPRGALGHVRAIELRSVAGDLLLRVDTREPDLELVQTASADTLRGQHVAILQLVRPGQEPTSREQVRRELKTLPYTPGRRCNEAFAGILRSGLDARALRRVFRPSTGEAAHYRGEALRRLARLSGGSLETVAGERQPARSPLELGLALERAPSLRDYLGLLGALAERKPEPASFLHAVLAPELAFWRFAALFERARSARGVCN